MTDNKLELFRAKFRSYLEQENDAPSLKNFHHYAPEFIVNNSSGESDIKGFWMMKFSKIVEELSVQNTSKEQPDWKAIKLQVTAAKSSSSKKRSHSVTSSSTIPQASSSNSASTDSTNKRRRKITNFLSGKGSQVIQLGPNTDKWVVNENEITVALLKFRAGVIERAQRGTLTTYQEELAINCIFVIDGLNSVYPSSELMYGFDDNTWQAMVDECNSRYPLQQLSDATEAALLKFAKAGKRKFADCTSTVNIITNEYICEALRNITRTYSPTSAKKSDANESTFSISTVHPFILPFLEETELTRLKGTDGEAYGSKRTKKNGGFSDLSVNFECGMMPSQGLLIVEIKPPHKVKNGSRPDLVKLGNEMKDALDKMVKDGIDDKEITVIGVLIEGFRCTIFVMDLMYQATYRLIPLSIFYLPRDRHDFDCLGNTFEALVTMRHMFLANSRRCFASNLEKECKAVRGYYLVESYDTVMQEEDQDDDAEK